MALFNCLGFKVSNVTIGTLVRLDREAPLGLYLFLSSNFFKNWNKYRKCNFIIFCLLHDVFICKINIVDYCFPCCFICVL